MEATRPRLAGQRLTAWVLGGGGLLLAAVAVVLHVADWGKTTGDLTFYVPNSAVGCAALSVLGALILRRHARHPTGVLLVGLGLGRGFRDWRSSMSRSERTALLRPGPHGGTGSAASSGSRPMHW